MLWSTGEPASGDFVADIARYGIIVLNMDQLGLRWVASDQPGVAELIDPDSIPAAREMLDRLASLNPHARVLVQVMFYEDAEGAYGKGHPWWLRDGQERVQYWPGTYRMDLANSAYVAHVARRIMALEMATGGRCGIFLDNLRCDPASRQAWLSLLGQARILCGQRLAVLINAGWESHDLDWIAPHLNGLLFEDGLHHLAAGDSAAAYYARLHRLEGMTRQPRLSVHEVYGPREDRQAVARELARTLIHTDMAFIYADSTEHHAHAWLDGYGRKIGLPVDGPTRPATPSASGSAMASRGFASGSAMYCEPVPDRVWDPQARLDGLPDAPMADIFTGLPIAPGLELSPGEGLILQNPPQQR